MTTENTTITETLETEDNESLEDTILASISELSDEEAETNNNLHGGESQAPQDEKAPTSDETSQAAKILAKSKRKDKETPEEKAADEGEQSADDKPSGERKLEPSIRWPVETKEWFNKQSPEIQKEALRGWNEIENYTTKLWQDINREQQRFSQLDQVVKHYAPKWNLQGMTDVQAIGELCATQDLILKDPLAACDMIMQKSGVTPEQIQARREGGVPATPQQQNTNSLTPGQVRQMIAEANQQNQSQTQLQSAVSEVKQVRNETDAEGRYTYPELHDQNYLERVKPLVESLRKTQPGTSFTEATRKAVQTLRVMDGQGSPSPQASRLSQNEIDKVRNASVSVRGRGNAGIPQAAQAKNGESLTDSIEASMSMLSQH